MSMPLPIHVVIAAASKAAFTGLENVEGLQNPGISPRYLLGALEHPGSGRPCSFDLIDHSSVGYWIALDGEAFSRCKEVFKALEAQKGYSRGLYDIYLPDPVVLAQNVEELQGIVRSVWDAFCATS